MPIRMSNGIESQAPPAEIPKQKERRQIMWELSEAKYDLSDLILDKSTASQLLDVISYFQNRTLLFETWGLGQRFPQQLCLAVNLYGPPGTGKTMGAHAIAKAISMPLICVDYAEIESKYVGETSKNLSDLFRTAQEKQAVIFFDEADALLSKRITNMTSATDVSVNQTRSVLLNLLNGYQGVILFATNFIQNFDAAFLRRIKFHIEFHLPDQALRERLWRLYIPDKMPCQADFAYLAATYDGVSGSDIANAVFSAAVAAARERETMVTQPYLEKAIQSVLRVKRVNAGGVTVSVRRISEEEAQQKMGGSKLSWTSVRMACSFLHTSKTSPASSSGCPERAVSPCGCPTPTRIPLPWSLAPAASSCRSRRPISGRPPFSCSTATDAAI